METSRFECATETTASRATSPFSQRSPRPPTGCSSEGPDRPLWTGADIECTVTGTPETKILRHIAPRRNQDAVTPGTYSTREVPHQAQTEMVFARDLCLRSRGGYSEAPTRRMRHRERRTWRATTSPRLRLQVWSQGLQLNKTQPFGDQPRRSHHPASQLSVAADSTCICKSLDITSQVSKVRIIPWASERTMSSTKPRRECEK